MAQAATATTDELISQLASSEIDRLLAEADGNPAPPEIKAPAEVTTLPESKTPRPDPAPVAADPEGSERAALLQAAGFESQPPAHTPPAPPATFPAEDERSALLQAAGFESPVELHFDKPGAASDPEENSNAVPLYLKPLVWFNLPLDAAPAVVRQILGKVGLVTLFNALAVLTYVLFFRRH